MHYAVDGEICDDINSYQCLKTAQPPPTPSPIFFIYTLIFGLTKENKSYSYMPSTAKSTVRLKATNGNGLLK